MPQRITFETAKVARLGNQAAAPQRFPVETDNHNLLNLMFYYTHTQPGRSYILNVAPGVNGFTEAAVRSMDQIEFKTRFGIVESSEEMALLIELHLSGARYAELFRLSNRTPAQDAEIFATQTRYLASLEKLVGKLHDQCAGPIYSMAW